MKQKIIDFIEKYPTFYPEYLDKKIQNKIQYGYTCDVNQIYCHLNLVDIRKTDYWEFYNIVRNKFSLENKKILEISCGFIPIVSSIIKKQVKNSHLYAINLKILFSNYNNINTIEYDLNQDYDISDFDLILGFRPCDITEKMICNAIKSKKSFAFYLCPCSLKPLENPFKGRWSTNRWHNYLISLIEQRKDYEIEVIKSEKMMDTCPIIIAKYKNMT